MRGIVVLEQQVVQKALDDYIEAQEQGLAAQRPLWTPRMSFNYSCWARNSIEERNAHRRRWTLSVIEPVLLV